MAIKINVYNQTGEAKGQLEVSEKIFGVKANPVVINEAAVAQLANSRQVLAHTKIRSEVRGGGRKPWRQKGTGRARAGSSRSPIWIGGGITFGPRKDRNFSKKINKKEKRQAIFMVLSDRLAENHLLALEEPALAEAKTKIFDRMLTVLEEKVLKIFVENPKKKGKKVRQEKRSILFVFGGKNETVSRAGRNLAGVKMLNSENINVIDLLAHKNIIFTATALKKLEKTYQK